MSRSMRAGTASDPGGAAPAPLTASLIILRQSTRADLVMRTENAPVDAGGDCELPRRRRARATYCFFDHPASVDPCGVNIGMPSAARVARDGAAEIIVAGDHALDIDAVDLLAVVGDSDGEMPVEPGRLHLDVGDLSNAVMVEIDDQFRGRRRIRRFLPAGLVDREA